MTQESQQVDVVVVGLGPGGESLATQLAKAGLKVVGVDQRLVGGECPYYGCIPSKMVIRAADALQEGRRIPDLAGTSTVEPDWAPVHARIRDEATTDWDDKIAVDRLVAGADAGDEVGERVRLGHAQHLQEGPLPLSSPLSCPVSAG